MPLQIALRPLVGLASGSRAPAMRAFSAAARSSLRCTCTPLLSPVPSALGTRTTSRALSTQRASPMLQSLLKRFSRSRPLSSAATLTLPAEPVVKAVPLTSPQVATYLLVIAGMVFSIVVVGGLTRLTESGLSITEWNVVSGIMPPLGQADWESEFTKYKDSPEWRLQNSSISMSDFKTIYFWEWSHRILGRVIGLSFLAPIPYFLLRRRLSPRATLSLLGIGTLIGCQGAMGWYMVKSGLDEAKVMQLGGVPRVSQYRLAAHLGMAFLVYSGCVRLSLGVARDWKIVNGGADKFGAGLGGLNSVKETLEKLATRTAGRTRILVGAMTGLIFLTAISGAFVAGLDAGLVYNEFPLMGGRLVPPTSELFSDLYSRTEAKTDRWWRNMLENPTTVQFDHRVLAVTTFASIMSLWLYVRRPTVAMHLPPTTLRLIRGTFHMSLLQVSLGISTLIYLVPIPLASAHQAGSLVLLTLALASGASLRRPGKVAREMLKLKGVKLPSSGTLEKALERKSAAVAGAAVVA